MRARNRKQSTKAFGMARPKRKAESPDFHPDHLALPQDEIRRLVTLSTTKYRIEPLVNQMVRVMDDLKAGKIRRVATLTVSRRDQSRATLIDAISNAARKGHTLAAHETAFLAALHAYENSLDHLRAFLGYLDDFRKPTRRRERTGSALR